MRIFHLSILSSLFFSAVCPSVLASDDAEYEEAIRLSQVTHREEKDRELARQLEAEEEARRLQSEKEDAEYARQLQAELNALSPSQTSNPRGKKTDSSTLLAHRLKHEEEKERQLTLQFLAKEKERLRAEQIKEEERVVQEENEQKSIELARQLEAEWNTPRPSQTSSRQNTQQLEREETLHSRTNSLAPVRLSETDQSTLQDILKTYNQLYEKAVREGYDVHHINKTFVAGQLNKVLALDEAYLHSNKTTSMKEVKNLISAHLISNKTDRVIIENLEKTFAKLATYPVTRKESETGIYVEQMLSQVWDLSGRIDYPRHRFMLPTGKEASARDYLCYSLAENIAEHGGCFPGIAGRLFRDFLLFQEALLLK